MKKWTAMKLRHLANWLDPTMYAYIKFDDTQMTEIKPHVKDTCDDALATCIRQVRV